MLFGPIGHLISSGTFSLRRHTAASGDRLGCGVMYAAELDVGLVLER